MQDSSSPDKNIDLSRRRVVQQLTGSVLLLASAPVLAKPSKCLITPAQTEGPFYPVHALSSEADLTQVKGQKRAQGKIILVEGRVTNLRCEPLRNAQVDIWQANHNGRYRHPRDPNKAKLDPGFIGAVRLQTDANGRYKVKTIFPGIYPIGQDVYRPPHIHFKVAHASHKSLTTQMYFPGNSYNDKDFILNNIPQAQRATVISRQEKDEATGLTRYVFDVVLA